MFGCRRFGGSGVERRSMATRVTRCAAGMVKAALGLGAVGKRWLGFLV